VNRAKLDAMQGQETVERSQRKNLTTGKMEEFEVKTTVPPLYERVEKSIVDNALVREVAIEVAKLLAAKETGDTNLPPEGEDEDEDDLLEPVGTARVSTRKLPEPPKRRGRADLAAPIR